jgi:hypothetical protein
MTHRRILPPPGRTAESQLSTTTKRGPSAGPLWRIWAAHRVGARTSTQAMHQGQERDCAGNSGRGGFKKEGNAPSGSATAQHKAKPAAKERKGKH